MQRDTRMVLTRPGGPTGTVSQEPVIGQPHSVLAVLTLGISSFLTLFDMTAVVIAMPANREGRSARSMGGAGI